MPVDLSLLPNRVRHDEIEQSAFFGSLLLFEQSVHVLREFEQPDTSLHVMAVGGSLAFDVGQNAGLLVAIPGGLPREKGNVESAVEPIVADNIEAVLQARVFLIEFRDGFITEPLLIPSLWRRAVQSSSQCPRQSRGA
jgi:hypothetical protein